jgi:hypothetical protein
VGLVCALLTLALAATSARATFIITEDFSGTTLDTSTWLPYASAGGIATQNDGLTETTPAGVFNYITKSQGVSVGQRVETSWRINAAGADWGTSLSLVSPPAVAQNWNDFDDNFTVTQVASGASAFQFFAFHDGVGHPLGSALPLALDTTYKAELVRSSASTVTANAYDSAGSLIGSVDFTGLLGDPASMLIDLSNQSATSTFSGVTIAPAGESSTPEPSTAALVLTSLAFTCGRRRRA